MKTAKLLLVAALATFLFGCASGARMEKMAYTGPGAEQKAYDETLREEVAVAPVSGGEETNPLWASKIGNEEFLGPKQA